MNKYLKYGLISVGAVFAAFVALIALVAATFNPNDYKPLIVKLVQEKKQRTLKLDGDIRLTFFPRIGADLGRFTLSEHNKAEEFATVERARVSLALLPLLRKELVVDRIRIEGVRARLVRFKDGTTNIDDLLKKEEEQKFKFDIEDAKVTNSALTLEDRMGGRSFVVSGLDLKTGRLAEGKPSDLDLGFRLQGDGVNAQVKAVSALLFDTRAKRFKLDKIDAEARGEAAGIANLAVGLKGGVDFDGAAKTVGVENLALAVTGKRGADNLDIRLVAPRLRWSGEAVSAEKVNLVAQLQQTAGNIDLVLNLPALAGTAKSFRADKLTLELNGKQGETEFRNRLESPVAGNLEARQLELSAMRASVTVMNPSMPAALNGGKGLSADISGLARVDLEAQNVVVDATAKLDASNIKAKLGVSRFDQPHYSFDVAIDRLDVDRYLPKEAGKAPQQEKPFGLSALKKLDASGSLRIGELKVSNIKSSNVRLEVKAAGGTVDVGPLSANLYQGSTSGSLRLDADASPQVSVKQNLSGISIGPLLRDALDKDILEGKGSVVLDVKTRGATVGAMKKALQGRASMNLRDGTVKGINLAATLRNAKAKLGVLRGEQVQAANQAEKTDFSELRASFNIRDGVARNNDLSAKSPLLRLAGNGDINLGESRMNYLARATVVASLKGQGGRDLAALKGVTVPVRIAGPFDSLKYTLDFNALAGEVVKQKVEEKKEAVKSRVEEELQKGLRGLFK